MISRIHHVGVVVQDLDAGLAFWRDTLELPLLRSADVADQGVRAALLACGSGEVEVLAPMTSDSGVARFLESRGEGVHHVCFESDDVVREVRRFLGTGVDMIDGKPRPGLAGKVAFVHPRACEKLLVELATPSARAPLPETPLALAAVHGKVEDVGAAAQRLQDLFGMTLGFAPEDGSVVQLSLGGAHDPAEPAGRRLLEAGVHGAAAPVGRPVRRWRAGSRSAVSRTRRAPWDWWSPRGRARARRSSCSPAADPSEEDSRVRLKGQVALVTGGGTGIGRGISLAFAREGASVVLNYQKSKDKAEATVREIHQAGGHARAVQADVRQEADCKRLVDETVRESGRLDVLVNNAGWTTPVPHGNLEALTDEIWQKVLDTNVMGVWYCIKHAAPVMRGAGTGRHHQHHVDRRVQRQGLVARLRRVEGGGRVDDPVARAGPRAGDPRERDRPGSRGDGLRGMAEERVRGGPPRGHHAGPADPGGLRRGGALPRRRGARHDRDDDPGGRRRHPAPAARAHAVVPRPPARGGEIRPAPGADVSPAGMSAPGVSGAGVVVPL